MDSDARCRKHETRLDEMEGAVWQLTAETSRQGKQLDLALSRIGQPPNSAEGQEGSGMARQLSVVVDYVQSQQDAKGRPMDIVRSVAVILAVLVPIIGAAAWAIGHIVWVR